MVCSSPCPKQTTSAVQNQHHQHHLSTLSTLNSNPPPLPTKPPASRTRGRRCVSPVIDAAPLLRRGGCADCQLTRQRSGEGRPLCGWNASLVPRAGVRRPPGTSAARGCRRGPLSPSESTAAADRRVRRTFSWLLEGMSPSCRCRDTWRTLRTVATLSRGRGGAGEG